jgi:hypothetical protein
MSHIARYFGNRGKLQVKNADPPGLAVFDRIPRTAGTTLIRMSPPTLELRPDWKVPPMGIPENAKPACSFQRRLGLAVVWTSSRQSMLPVRALGSAKPPRKGCRPG